MVDLVCRFTSNIKMSRSYKIFNYLINWSSCSLLIPDLLFVSIKMRSKELLLWPLAFCFLILNTGFYVYKKSFLHVQNISLAFSVHSSLNLCINAQGKIVVNFHVLCIQQVKLLNCSSSLLKKFFSLFLRR